MLAPPYQTSFSFYYQIVATMASLRKPTAALFTTQVCRQCARTLSRRPLLQQAGRVHFSQQPRHFKQPYKLDHGEIKTDYKLPPLETKVYQFDQVKQLSESPSPERILIGKLNLATTVLSSIDKNRCARTFRVQRRLHTRCNQYAHQITTRRSVLTGRRVRRQIRLRETLTR